ncbi:oxygenase MpaB family protein [Lentzea sp.]|uniref:oxygenase MpaB family protein n=1 Tax=Lentzea sp. TaxID=56099 RepID=UPI002BDA8D1A|nr:oxygenase MpaB family protein [Lentzea sp.]HUQ55946.1 oxygenase MpaB family protein [Lentzea sp.]
MTLGPESMTWRLGWYTRFELVVLGRAVLMQVAHPVIAAAVRDGYRADPFARLTRTITSSQLRLFGGEQAAEEARRLVEWHARIPGADEELFRWVHATSFDSLLTAYRLLRPRLPAIHEQRLYGEWRDTGRALGIRSMPEDLEALREYVDDVVATQLMPTDGVEGLLEAFELRSGRAPGSEHLPSALWPLVRPVAAQVLPDFAVGTLPPELRDKLGLEWTDGDERRLRLWIRAIRVMSACVPASLLHYPMPYQAMLSARSSRV